MSEYNPCSHCGYDSSSYKALRKSRDELLRALKYLYDGSKPYPAKSIYDTIKKAEVMQEKASK